MRKMTLLLGSFLLIPLLIIGKEVNAEEVISSDVNHEYLLEITDSTSEISNVLTFEEITKEISKDLEISLTDAENMVLQNSTSKSVASVKAATFRTLSQQFTVTSTYKPTMKFYCETSESGLYHGVLKILTVNMIRGYNGISKQFGGTVYTNLERSDRIYFIVNGDFYNNGTTTFNAGVNIGIGESASVSFGVSNSSNHYAYRYIESYLNW